MRVFLWRATMRSLASGLVFLWRAMRAGRRWWWDPKACKEGKKTLFRTDRGWYLSLFAATGYYSHCSQADWDFYYLVSGWHGPVLPVRVLRWQRTWTSCGRWRCSARTAGTGCGRWWPASWTRRASAAPSTAALACSTPPPSWTPGASPATRWVARRTFFFLLTSSGKSFYFSETFY